MASIHNPLGLIVPVITPLMCILQDLWKQERGDAPSDEV